MVLEVVLSFPGEIPLPFPKQLEIPSDTFVCISQMKLKTLKEA